MRVYFKLREFPSHSMNLSLNIPRRTTKLSDQQNKYLHTFGSEIISSGKLN